MENQVSVFVGGLPWSWGDQDLLAEFKPYGALSARVILDHETNRSRGFGFVAFSDQKAAEAAVSAVNGRQVGKLQLQVKIAEHKPHTKPRSGPEHSRTRQGGPKNDRRGKPSKGEQSPRNDRPRKGEAPLPQVEYLRQGSRMRPDAED